MNSLSPTCTYFLYRWFNGNSVLVRVVSQNLYPTPKINVKNDIYVKIDALTDDRLKRNCRLKQFERNIFYLYVTITVTLSTVTFPMGRKDFRVCSPDCIPFTRHGFTVKIHAPQRRRCVRIALDRARSTELLL